MITLAQLKKTSDNFGYQRMMFNKKDLAYILNRDKITTRFNDFLTLGYYQRKRLISEGYVGACYTYRIHLSDGKNKNHRTFALFCPNHSLMIDEDFFTKIIARIEEMKEQRLGYKEKKFLNYYSMIEAKPRYYKIDEKLCEGKRVYLQYIEWIPHLNKQLNLGLNYVLYGPLITKDMLYLPDKYI